MIKNITAAQLEAYFKDRGMDVVILAAGLPKCERFFLWHEDLQAVAHIIPDYDSSIMVENPDTYEEDKCVYVVDMPMWLLTIEVDNSNGTFRTYSVFNTESADQAREEGRERAGSMDGKLIEIRQVAYDALPPEGEVVWAAEGVHLLKTNRENHNG